MTLVLRFASCVMVNAELGPDAERCLTESGRLARWCSNHHTGRLGKKKFDEYHSSSEILLHRRLI